VAPLSGGANDINMSEFAGLMTLAFTEYDNHSQLSADDEDQREDFPEKTRGIFANLTLLLGGLPIASVLFSSHQHREDPVQGMFSGRKSRD
jgi:cytochrome b